MNFQDKSAFISIVGRPNAGKSSLLNRMLGQKIAIVSDKPQTTRTRIMGVLTQGEHQLVFTDTPGMHKPRTSLGNYMVRSVKESVSSADACLLVVEAGREPDETEKALIERASQMSLPMVLAINKTDLIKQKQELMSLIITYSSMYNFHAIVPLSAKTGDGVDALIEELKLLCEEGGHFFEADTLTDQSERVLAAEMLREKLLRNLDKEIPHGTAVIVEKMKQRDNGILDIEATIYCERDSHKGIIIGKGGKMLKKVSATAREDMERFFDCKVNLQTWVKVREDWRNREGIMRSLGFSEKDFL